MARPNKVIIAMKNRDYKSTIWEMLLYEYRMAKMGNHENRLGPNALTSLVTALKDMRAQEVEDKKDNDTPNLIELEEWVKENKG
jgi:hypothetical protein